MKKHLLLLSLIVAGSTIATAQSLNSGYFLDGYNYGGSINPAFQPDGDTRAYFGLLINNVNVNAHANVGASSFYFPVNGALVYGLNNKIPADTFLSKLKETNTAGATYNENLLNFGLRTKSGKGFFSFDCGIKGYTDTSVPKSLFEMLKKGVKEDNEYSVNDIALNSKNYLECALGYSHKIGDKVKVGAKVKFLVGMAYVDMYLDNLSVYGIGGEYFTSGKGTMNIACPSARMDVTYAGNYDVYSFGYGNIGVAGFGVGFDIGATYDPIEDLTLDFAIQDIGSINWNENINGKMDYRDKSLITDGKVDFEKLLDFKPQETAKQKWALPMTFRVGAKYKMPFYKKLSARLLGTFMTGSTKYTDVRLGATVTPIKQISATVNYGLTTYGSTMGAAINFNLGFFNLFLGADSIINPITPQGLPINHFSVSVSGGITFQIKDRK